MLGLVGGVLALGLVEAALRLVDAVPEVANPLYSFHDSDPVLGWRGRPDARLRFRRPQFDVEIAHDGRGFRLPDPLPPSAPARRVLALGDSFTWGWGVPQGAVYTDRLQRALADVAVDNRGVNGFGTGQEYLLLQQELTGHRYDVVLVQFFFNDVAENLDRKSGRRPLFRLDGDRLLPPSGALRPLSGPLLQGLKDHSRAFLLLDFTTRRLGGGNDAAPTLPPAAAVTALDWRAMPGGALTERLLEAIVATASAHGARVVIAYAPHRLELEAPDAVPPAVRAARALAEHAAASRGARGVDLTPALAAVRGEAVLFPGDEHWTAAGHAAVAGALLDAGAVALPPGG
ncbi:MAG: SGNH/GDSL hydrolase family protein [Candidatus Binatia bacterium]